MPAIVSDGSLEGNQPSWGASSISTSFELGDLLLRGLTAGPRPLNTSFGLLLLAHGRGERAIGIRQLAFGVFQVALGRG
jgi:hypothetical protein